MMKKFRGNLTFANEIYMEQKRSTIFIYINYICCQARQGREANSSVYLKASIALNLMYIVSLDVMIFYITFAVDCLP